MKKTFLNFILIFLFILVFAFADTKKDSVNDLNLLFNQALLSYYNLDFEKSKKDFEKLINQDIQNSLAITYYISCIEKLDKIDEFINSLEDYLTDNPNDYKKNILLGYAYYMETYKETKGALDEALLTFKFILRDKKISSIYTGIGIVNFDKGRINYARRQFKRAIKLNDKDFLAYEYLGHIYFYVQKDYQKALKYYKYITDNLPVYPDAHYFLANTYYKLSLIDEAILQLKEAIKYDKNGITKGLSSYVFLGDLLVEKGDYSNALSYYKKALDFKKDDILIIKKIKKVEKLLKK